MFCPLCKAEYRDGFYRCSDCDVDLVATLPPQPDPPPPETDDAGADSVILCQEDDPATLTAILAALQDRGIRYHDYPIHNPKETTDRPFPARFNVAPAYEIRVPRPDLLAAQSVLADALAGEPEVPQADVHEDATAEGAAPDAVEADEALPPDAVLTEIWSGAEGHLAHFLTTALRENGIPSRRENLEADPIQVRIFVPQEKLPRAREIVREITQGAPPD